MIRYQDVRHIHLEPSSYCNARCPLCPRNHYGVNRDDLGFSEHHMTLKEFRQIFDDAFLAQLKEINCNGNFGDPCMNPELLEIFEHCLAVNPKIKLGVCTNGGMRNKDFWYRMGELGIEVMWSIDGLEDTNHLYRQDVIWSNLMRNLDAYLVHGQRAIWKMIVFDHNRHQIQAVKDLVASKGIENFIMWDSGETAHGRNSGPVFDRQGNLSHVIGKYTGSIEYQEHQRELLDMRTNKIQWDLIDFDPDSIRIDCFTKKNSSIYVTSTGLVFPCCFLGNATETFGRPYMRNLEQVYEILENHNALVHGLHQAMAWFDKIEPRWQGKNNQERLFMCDSNCGQVWINDRNLAQTTNTVRL